MINMEAVGMPTPPDRRRCHPPEHRRPLATRLERRYSKFMYLALFLSLLAVNAEPDAQPSVKKYGGDTYFGEYKPAKAKSLDDIPEPARSRIVEHLKKRLGEKFYSILKLSGGQIVDLDELRRKEPNSKNYQWEAPAYLLHFEFRMPEKGIAFYQATIECRRDGSVIKEIDLPEIAKHPERGTFVSLKEALKAAKGFDLEKSSVEMDYREKEGKCVYRVTQLVRETGPRLFFKSVDIDAHTGRAVAVYKSEGIK
jgi:hypothetical protein